MSDCTCSKPIGEGRGKVPRSAADGLIASGLFTESNGVIQYDGRVGTVANNELGIWHSPEICPVHTPHVEPEPSGEPIE